MGYPLEQALHKAKNQIKHFHKTQKKEDKHMKYKTVDTRTLKGLKQAERLQSLGWKIISIGFYTIQFEKPKG